jgi:hypothetical protein
LGTGTDRPACSGDDGVGWARCRGNLLIDSLTNCPAGSGREWESPVLLRRIRK